jgi:hypothetical protein
MAAGNFWDRVREDVRGLTERTRRGARLVIEQGVLRVDLVSLRRARTRALADLGGRTLTFWNEERTVELESDAEAVRLRARIADVDGRIREKEDALQRLRVPKVAIASMEERRNAANTEGTNGIT